MVHLTNARDNIETHGNIESIEFIKGLFSNSFQTFGRPLKIVWLDAGLKDSIKDALRYLYPNLSKNSVIFSDNLDAVNNLYDSWIGVAKATKLEFYNKVNYL